MKIIPFFLERFLVNGCIEAPTFLWGVEEIHDKAATGI